MTQDQLAKAAKKALDEYVALPDEVKWRLLIERGIINEQGEVLWNLEYARQVEAEEKARANGYARPSPGRASDSSPSATS